MSVVGSRTKRLPCSSNCATCGHKQVPDGGWCYMFKEPPEGRCYQHTGEKGPLTDLENLIRQAQLMSADSNEGAQG